MAEPTLLDTSPFDLHHYPPHLFDSDLSADACDLPLAADFGGDPQFNDLEFDVAADFSIDDFLRSPDHPSGSPQPSESGAPSAAGSGASSSSSGPRSPESGGCSAASAVTASAHVVKHEEAEEAKTTNWSLKRKKAKEDGLTNPNPNPSPSSVASKCQRSDGESSPSSASRAVADAADEEDERRAARLMRNRESAQLSRQRKKRYVEELEEKVKSMHSVINELNSKISYVMAENATLRQQLSGGGASGNCPLPPPPGVCPLPGVPLPWVPGYTLRPHGSHVPLMPIPRLKPHQPAPAPKVTKKVESKKVEGKTKAKTKKVASVSFVGLLFAMIIFGAVFQGLNGNNAMFAGIGAGEVGNFGQSQGRVLSVTGHGRGINGSNAIGVDCSGKIGNAGGGGFDSGNGQKCRSTQNSTESLPALLYVPRNGKHVKINGNLIIHSVLASEKAVAHSASNVRQSSGKDGEETSLAVAPYVSRIRQDMDQHESSPTDGPLPQWFREGMAGPILSSGMCSEVFQFDISPASAHPGGIIPATSIVNSSSVVNATEKLPTPAHNGKIKNRRIMYNEAIPLTGRTVNNTDSFNKTSESSKLPDGKPVSPVVVSVLADPREAGDGDGDARISPKSLSRIFVVVLLDGVKYVTYSCVLPFKSSGPHLVD